MSAGPGGTVPAGLAAAARAWMDADPDPGTRAELGALLAAGDTAALAERFTEPLTFGTAGLRAPLGAGPARMNRLVVRRTTAGVARWLLGRGEEAAAAGIVVGHDARHGSAAFAADVAEVAAAMGVRVRVLPSPLPTPLAAFAVLHYGAAAGVVVTASHNPAPDNGYKVYASDGAQIVPPDDEAIARAAALTGGGVEAPPAGSPPAAAGLAVDVGREELLGAYLDAVAATPGLLGAAGAAQRRALRIVYTPVHGVGGLVLPDLLERLGFARPLAVPSQAEPDPDFPTAPFPNPEEAGVLDPALAEAARTGADLVIANDPDADRLAVAVPAEGGWRVLSGDELGVLLGDHLIRAATAGAAAGATAGAARQPAAAAPVVATSIVSSTLLAQVAAAAGVETAETLTGFKWIARAADGRGRLLFGYEEALGYAVSTAVRDKDGLSAALLVAEMAAAAKAAGRRLDARLDELSARFGVHLTSQVSLRYGGAGGGAGARRQMAAVVDAWRAGPPAVLGPMAVTGSADLEQGLHGLPATPGVLLRLAAEGAGVTGRVVLRPSGTEAKLKAYLEVVTPPAADVTAARATAGRAMAGLRAAVEASLRR